MYQLIDMATNTIIHKAENKTDLLIAWAKNVEQYSPIDILSGCNLEFEDLNVSGRDIRIQWQPDGGYTQSVCDKRRIPTYHTVQVPRRYQVRDERGRSIDIRKWTDEIQYIRNGISLFPTKTKHQPVFRSEPADCGRKSHMRRVQLPSMMVQHVRQSDTDRYEKWDDDTLLCPIRNRSRIRKRFSLCQVDESISRKITNRYNKRCWKQQTHNGRQWAKHKTCVKRDGRANIPILELDTDQLLHDLQARQTAVCTA